MDDSIIERLEQVAPRAFAGTPVVFAYLFGSTARGDARPDSDVDVAVYLGPEAPPGRSVDLALELAGRLEREAGIGPVEVIALNGAALPVAGRVLRERVVLYSRDEPARVRYESRMMREFLDFQIHAEPLDRQILKDMAEGRR